MLETSANYLNFRSGVKNLFGAEILMNNSFKRISFIPPALKLPACASDSGLRCRFGKQAAGILITFILLLAPLAAQTYIPTRTERSLVPRSGERYVTDEFGVIRMYVNVWGHVNRPGSYLVYDGIDLATLLSVTGGPKRGANFKGVTLFREIPDENGNLIYHINMDNFLKTGDRSEFVKILPNDTLIIQQKVLSYVLSQTGLLNTFLSMLNLYYLIQYNSSRY